jgi:hypothetical protein
MALRLFTLSQAPVQALLAAVIMAEMSEPFPPVDGRALVVSPMPAASTEVDFTAVVDDIADRMYP